MGIPSYFRKIIEEYSDTHFWDPDLDVDHFFIDFNAMIYQVLILMSQEFKKEGKDISELSSFQYESLLLPRIIQHMEHVICKVIRPKKSLYIAVDGPPPRAKMIQQRFRRYKSVQEFYYKRSLENKYKIELPRSKWTSSSISPGTVFMDKLSREIIKGIKSGRFSKHILKNKKRPIEGDQKVFKIVFSDYSVPGEGEHKLLPEVRKLRNSNDSIVVYSPDADLIVLTLMTHINNIYILREPKDSEIELALYKNNEFLYLSIDKCRDGFLTDLQSEYQFSEGELSVKTVMSKICNDFLFDYSFITFLCGNDFVIARQFLKVKEGGIDILMSNYKDIFYESGKHLTERSKNGRQKINISFFRSLIKELASEEGDRMQKWQKKRDRVRKGTGNPHRIAAEEKMEPWQIDFSRFQHEEYYSPRHPLYENFNKVFNKINYYDPDWISQYDKFFFDISEGDSDYEEMTDAICKEYYRSLCFCLDYYQGDYCHVGKKKSKNEFGSYSPSWTWFYPFRNAPTFEQFSKFLESHNDEELRSFEKFEMGIPFKPLEQLMLILPKQTMYLLPRSLSTIDEELAEFFPQKVMLDIVQGTKFIYSEPILPAINTNLIRKKVKDAKLNKFERIRNTIRNRPYVHTFDL